MPHRSWYQRTWHLLGRLDFLALLYLLAICFCLWAFLAVADSVREGTTEQLDITILLAFRDQSPEHRPIGPAWLPGAVRDITALGSTAVLVLLTLAVGCFYLLQGKWQTGLFFVTTVLVGWLATDGLKQHYGRERPTVVPHLTKETSLSFPSGHARMSAVVYLTLAALLAQRAQKKSLKIYWISLGVALTLLVGTTRVYLGVHNPSDVLAGWLVGAAWAMLAFLLARLWRFRLLLRRWHDRHNLRT